MSVVGFDVGAKTCFIAVAKNGGIETVANEYSARATPAFVSFGEEQRALGTNAQQKLVTNLKNTCYLFKHLVGRPFDDELVKRYQPMLSYELIKMEKTGRVGVKVVANGEEELFSMEQILAMLLGKLKQVAESNMEGKLINDCVITCPFYLTNSERSAWLEASKIAGLNCLRLFNETTATALAYGIFKTDLPEVGQDPRRVVFVDCGYTQTTCSLANFNKGQLQMKCTYGDRNLGGLDFDNLLVDHFAEEFKPKYKIDVKTNKRAEIRLGNECEKLKKQMSANATPLSVNVECIMNDKDVSGKMQRDQFVELCRTAGYLDRMKAVFQQCKNQMIAGETLDCVEMVGGSSRIPFVRDLIQEVFGLDAKTTMNADESVSRGAALQCAMLSPTFRVRDFEVKDVQSHPIRIDWVGSDGKPGNALIFEENESVPLSKVLTFTRKDISPFKVSASYQKEDFSYYPEKHLGDFVIGGIKTPTIPGFIPENINIKLKVKLRIDNHGQLVVPQAVQIDKQEVEVPVTEEDEKKAEEEKKSEEKMDDKKEEKSAEKAGEEAPKTKITTKSVKLELPVDSQLHNTLSRDTLDSYITKEFDMAAIDRREQDRQAAKNDVEECVYGSREKLYAQYDSFATDKEKESISAILTKTEDWLYEEGENETKQVYINKLTELKKLSASIVLRFNESESRGAVIEALGAKIQQARKFLVKYQEKDETVVHIAEAEVEKVSKATTDCGNWYDNSMNQINGLKKTQDPTVFTANFKAQYDALVTSIDKIMNTPIPVKMESPYVDDVEEEKKEEPPVDGQTEAASAEKTDAQEADKNGEKAPHMDVD